MVSDGADNAETTLDQPVASLSAQGVPVFAVGVGKERLSRDVQITRVETPRRVLKGAALVVDVVDLADRIRGGDRAADHRGRWAGGELQDVTLPPDGEAQTVKVRFKAGEAGLRTFSFSVPEQANEEVAQNNQREATIDVRDARERVLLAEGRAAAGGEVHPAGDRNRRPT